MDKSEGGAHVTRRSTVPRAAASVGGALLAAGTQALAALRPARKPLHPDGDVRDGTLLRRGADEKTGVAWLDEPGEDDVAVRLSRAIGLPRRLPDIHGLAVRVQGQAGGDLLFATTGRGRLSRFTLTASRHPQGWPLTTLLPYETDSGAVLLSAVGVGTETYELSWARPAGRWHAFATLRLEAPRGGDAAISFDPVRHQLPGLRQYPAVERLREPAYQRARRSRAPETDSSLQKADDVH
ncbi:hypothetical protein GCM10009798_13880 [Nocardioides panacihumi]|uniref:Phosphodiesterase n=1 Tax=Nocardioides panacihumi TaxID=400774 RepID=A0ABP5C0X9_9ACTN